MSGWSNGSAIQALASQIPKFGGREDDNVRTWIRRVEKIALVHEASDDVTLLAALGKLTASARRWFDIQTGTAIESWIGLRNELIKMFDMKIPFYKIMQKVEAKKWLPAKETFDEYAIEKLALMHRADLVEQDKIHLLISDITQPLLRGTALSVNASTMDIFLEAMRRITQGVVDQERKPATSNSVAKVKDGACRNCGKKGHGHKKCKDEICCFYCKEKGHRRFDCPLLKKKDVRK